VTVSDCSSTKLESFAIKKYRLPPAFLPRRTLKIIGKNALFHNVYLQVFHPKNTISWGGVFRLVKPIVEISFAEK
jgi:hypothetical protein